VLTFAFIVYFFPPSIALVTSSLWGLFLLSFLSYRIALHRQANPLRHTLWHIGIALLIVISSKVLGNVLFHFAS
jgi:VIT1/CCC1 family predicted Fe2+/Mn2+ transporter